MILKVKIVFVFKNLLLKQSKAQFMYNLFYK